MRACTSSNSRTFSMAITAWSAKVWTSSICLSVNGSTLLRQQSEYADRLALAQQRHAKHGADVRAASCAQIAVFGIGHDVGDVDRAAFQQRPARRPKTGRSA